MGWEARARAAKKMPPYAGSKKSPKIVGKLAEPKGREEVTQDGTHEARSVVEPKQTRSLHA
jgi:hypothetical protein